MPILWDHQCRFWKGDDQWIATSHRGPASSLQTGARQQQQPPVQQRDTRMPPPLKKALLDNGKGKRHLLNELDCPASMPRVAANKMARKSVPQPPPMKICHHTTVDGIGTSHSNHTAGLPTATSSSSEDSGDNSVQKMPVLLPPHLNTRATVTGASTDILRKENKVQHKETKA